MRIWLNKERYIEASDRSATAQMFKRIGDQLGRELWFDDFEPLRWRKWYGYRNRLSPPIAFFEARWGAWTPFSYVVISSPADSDNPQRGSD